MKLCNFFKLKKIFYCILSVSLLGISTGVCSRTGYGTNSISTFFDGISKTFNLNLGLSANIVNLILSILIFLKSKKYIGLGTIIYVLIMGIFINVGIEFYDFFKTSYIFEYQISMTLFGLILYLVSLGLFIASDIGVNPWVALSLLISDKTSKPFGFTKIVLDVSMLTLGILFGGSAGINTVIAAMLCGPCVQRFSIWFKKNLKL